MKNVPIGFWYLNWDHILQRDPKAVQGNFSTTNAREKWKDVNATWEQVLQNGKMVGYGVNLIAINLAVSEEIYLEKNSGIQ